MLLAMPRQDAVHRLEGRREERRLQTHLQVEGCLTIAPGVWDATERFLCPPAWLLQVWAQWRSAQRAGHPHRVLGAPFRRRRERERGPGHAGRREGEGEKGRAV